MLYLVRRDLVLWYFVDGHELGAIWSKENQLYEDGDVHLISDRLSFFRIRKGEDVVGFSETEKLYWARMIIDI